MTTWHLFPLIAATKRPAFKGWQAMSTDDETQWDAWEAEGYILGVDCEKSNILVVDLDGDEGPITWAALDMPKTMTQHGGRHHIYSGEGRSSVRALGPGVDTRGKGGLIVWYGDADDTPIAPLPANLAAELAIRPPRATTPIDGLDLPANVQRGLAFLANHKPAIEGQGGNDNTYQTAATLRDLGVSEDKSLELMLDWNERCDPPWDADELAGVIRHAWEYGQNEPGAQAIAVDPRTRFAGVGNVVGIESHERYRLWTIPEALTRPPPSWLFPGILPARSVGIAYGPQEVGKTWLILDQALHLATGLEGYGQEETEPRDVVYFSGEGFDDLVHSRINAWCAHHQHGVDRLEKFHLLENFPNVAEDQDVDRLIEAITKKRLQPRLIVLDTYSRVLAEAGLNENDPLDVMKFVRQAEILKRGFGCTVLGIHHAGKDIERGARGSNTLIANVDFAFEISANWDVHALQLRCAKMKVGPRFADQHFEAVPVGDSLVMRGITPDAYKALTAVEDQFSSRSVGSALAKLAATDAEHAVSDYSLAAALHTVKMGEPELETQATIDRVARKLRALGKGRLEQYVTRAGWHLPT